MDNQEIERQIHPYLDAALEAIAQDRGCEVGDLSGTVIRSVTDALLWAFHEGYDTAHEEPTVRTPLSMLPRGVTTEEEE